MSTKFFISVEEKQRLFHTELVKVGVDSHQAVRVAKILAQNQLKESLTPEESHLTEEACRLWLQHRQRLAFIEQTLVSVSAQASPRSPKSNYRNCAGFRRSLG